MNLKLRRFMSIPLYLLLCFLTPFVKPQDSDSTVEEDTRSGQESLSDLSAEFNDRDLLANLRRFNKRSRRVGTARMPTDKSKETCFNCERKGHFAQTTKSLLLLIH